MYVKNHRITLPKYNVLHCLQNRGSSGQTKRQIYTASHKNTSQFIDHNLKVHYQTLIIFCTVIPDSTELAIK